MQGLKGISVTVIHTFSDDLLTCLLINSNDRLPGVNAEL